jgi:DNA-binding MarR family transcriptional regulator
MKIEDEIKQKKFLNEYHKANINILFTASWLNTNNAQLFKGYGISPQQFNILRILRGQHPSPAPLKLLTERMIDKMSNTSRLVDKLYLKQLVDRRTCSDNRRQVDIILTEKGMVLVNEISNEIEKMSKSKQPITNEEAKELNRILDKMRG